MSKQENKPKGQANNTDKKPLTEHQVNYSKIGDKIEKGENFAKPFINDVVQQPTKPVNSDTSDNNNAGK